MPKLKDKTELDLVREMYFEGDPTKMLTEEDLKAKERREDYRRSRRKTNNKINQAR
jgi:hypothetical protein